MAWPLVLFAVTQAVSTYGKYQADQAQAEAEAKNASYYREQAGFIQLATERESALFKKKAARLQGDQVGAVAKGGIALSGDMLQQLAGERAESILEDNAIRADGSFKARLARLRANQADETARSLTGTTAQLGYAGSLLGASAQAGAFSGGSKSSGGETSGNSGSKGI